MSRNAEVSFFCRRCRAGDTKRCRCPLPAVDTNHDWDADAAYNLWPDRVEVPAAARAAWDGRTINLSELLERSSA